MAGGETKADRILAFGIHFDFVVNQSARLRLIVGADSVRVVNTAIAQAKAQGVNIERAEQRAFGSMRSRISRIGRVGDGYGRSRGVCLPG